MVRRAAIEAPRPPVGTAQGVVSYVTDIGPGVRTLTVSVEMGQTGVYREIEALASTDSWYPGGINSLASGDVVELARRSGGWSYIRTLPRSSSAHIEDSQVLIASNPDPHPNINAEVLTMGMSDGVIDMLQLPQGTAVIISNEDNRIQMAGRVSISTPSWGIATEDNFLTLTWGPELAENSDLSEAGFNAYLMAWDLTYAGTAWDVRTTVSLPGISINTKIAEVVLPFRAIPFALTNTRLLGNPDKVDPPATNPSLPPGQMLYWAGLSLPPPESRKPAPVTIELEVGVNLDTAQVGVLGPLSTRNVPSGRRAGDFLPTIGSRLLRGADLRAAYQGGSAEVLVPLRQWSGFYFFVTAIPALPSAAGVRNFPQLGQRVFRQGYSGVASTAVAPGDDPRRWLIYLSESGTETASDRSVSASNWVTALSGYGATLDNVDWDSSMAVLYLGRVTDGLGQSRYSAPDGAWYVALRKRTGFW